MKVMLINEASGVHKNLKVGLMKIGATVDHFVVGSLKGRNDYDGTFSPTMPGLLGGLSRNLTPLLTSVKLSHYDVISFCNTITSVHGMHTKYLDLPFIRKKADILSYYALGCDELGLIRRTDCLPYTPCEACLKSGETLGRDCEEYLNPRYVASLRLVRKYFGFGASSAIEYDHASRAFETTNFKKIQFPVLIDHIPFNPARPRVKVNIAHTPTRRGFKGTDVVIKAIKHLHDMRSDFNFSIIEGLPYVDYIKAIDETDIIIDQVYSQSSGINALEMLAAGKVVMTGSSSAGREYFDLGKSHPAYDAQPDPVLLAKDLCALLDRRNEFGEIAQAGRVFVETFHDPVRVAEKFLQGWRSAIANEPCFSSA